MIRKKVIIDTDPGVDDITAILVALFNSNFDVKLITSTAGNVGIEKTTRNLLHVLEKFDFNVLVAKGASKPLVRESKTASSVHGEEGLGKYIPKTPTKLHFVENAIDQMYKTILENKNDITIIELGPHTNLGLLFQKYPECENYINEIVFEGGSPYGKENIKPHISFNISCDPEAAKIVMNTKIIKTIIPSEMGRYITYFSPEDVNNIKNTNKTGEFLNEMFKGYVNRYNLDIIQTNDLSAIMYMLYPEIFKTYKCDIEIDTNLMPGKTTITENPNGLVTFVDNCDRKIFIENFMKNLNSMP